MQRCDCIALALEMGVPIYVAPEILVAEEQRDRKPEAASVGVGEVVAELIERWTGPSKPTR